MLRQMLLRQPTGSGSEDFLCGFMGLQSCVSQPCLALGMPSAVIFMGILTFGIFFTGLAPLLAIALTRAVTALELNRLRIAVSLMMLTVGWMLSGITGHLLGNA